MKRILSLFLCVIVMTNTLIIFALAQDANNLLPANNGLTKSVWGMEYSCTGGTYHINGTPKKSSYLNICGGPDTIPEGLCEGEQLKIRFSSGTAYVSLGIRAFNEENPNGIWLVKTSVDTEYIVPDLSEYSGVSIRILVSQCDRRFDLKVTPVIEKIVKDNENLLPNNNGLTKSVWGMEYSCTDGTYHINGTAKKSSYLNLSGGPDTIPEGLREGDQLKIRFSSGTAYVSLGIRAFNEENPDGIWLVKTSVDTEYIVPDLSEYSGVSIRILVSQCDRRFDLKVTPVIEKIVKDNENLLPNNNGLTKKCMGDGIFMH